MQCKACYLCAHTNICTRQHVTIENGEVLFSNCRANETTTKWRSKGAAVKTNIWRTRFRTAKKTRGEVVQHAAACKVKQTSSSVLLQNEMCKKFMARNVKLSSGHINWLCASFAAIEQLILRCSRKIYRLRERFFILLMSRYGFLFAMRCGEHAARYVVWPPGSFDWNFAQTLAVFIFFNW